MKETLNASFYQTVPRFVCNQQELRGGLGERILRDISKTFDFANSYRID